MVMKNSNNTIYDPLLLKYNDTPLIVAEPTETIWML